MKLIEKKVILKRQILSKQQDMYMKAKDYGLTHPLVVSISQE
ncbi:MAG: aspartyl-phosphate phosphatase Spo0E family protein, partial [Paenisporosarcina sp.]